jgi:ankyrin repeat protein
MGTTRIRKKVRSRSTSWIIVACVSLLPYSVSAQKQIDPFDAISKNEPALLAAYLKNGGNPNASDSLGSLLEYAVRADKIELVNLLLQRRADPKIKHGAPLFLASKEGYLDITQALISHGANVNLTSAQGLPLVAAMAMKHLDVAHLLLSAGATIPPGRFYLMWAIRSDSGEMTRIALAANGPNASGLNVDPNPLPGWDMEELSENGPLIEQATKPEVLKALLDAHFEPTESALAHCAAWCDVEMVRMLLGHGTNPNIRIERTGGGWSFPLIAAASMTDAVNGRAEVVRALLLAHAEVNSTDSEGQTALLCSVKDNGDEVVSYLLDAKADPNQPDKHGKTPLGYAVSMGKSSVVTLLLQNGANPNATADEPLLTAVRDGHLDIVNALLAHGADPNAGQYTPLLVAVQIGKLDIVKALVAHAATVNPIDGQTSLTLTALEHNHLDVLQFLLSHGANMPVGRAALMAAVRSRNAELTRLVLGQNSGLDVAALSLALASACTNGNIDIVNLLLKYGADPNLGSDDSGNPEVPLIIAAARGHAEDAEVVRALLLAHADPNLVDSKGNTALISASLAGSTNVARDLLDAKANPNHPDPDGNTALILASHYGRLDMVRCLLAAGADPNLKNKAEMTALLESASEGSATIISVLIAKGADLGVTQGGKSAIDLAKINGNARALTVLRSSNATERQQESLPRDLELNYSLEPRDLRHYLLDSTIFRDSFLLLAVNKAAEPLDLADYQQSELNAQIGFIFDFIRQKIRQRAPEIQRTMGVHLLPTDATTFKLEDSGKAAAYTVQTSSNPAGAIFIDVKLLQAALESSVLNDGQINYNAPTVPELTEEILRYRHEIENLAYLSHVQINKEQKGVLVSLSPNNKPKKVARDANHLASFAPKIFPAEVQYYGILLFVVAHELGHVALGHGLSEVPCSDRELAADSFAALVLGESLAAMSIRESSVYFFDAPAKATVAVGEYLALDHNDLVSYTGFSLFFNKSYELAKFGPSSRLCVYPEPADRLRSSQETVERVALSIKDSTIARLAERKDLQAFLDAGLIARQKVITEISQTGTDSEYSFLSKVAKQLRSQGYEVLGSRPGRPTELFAENDLKKILVHIDQNQGTLEAPVIRRIVGALKPSGLDPVGIDEVWIVGNSAFTPYAKALARKYRIRLIDSAGLKAGLKRVVAIETDSEGSTER